jgi:hypothetical protein
MIPLLSLWLPILLSAVAVFVASSIVHMFLKYHDSDYARLPEEDRVRAALRGIDLPQGDYVVPHAASATERSSPEYTKKLNEGPVLVVTVLKNGPFAMGGMMAQWFVYCAVVSLFAAYLASRTFDAGADYLSVFRVVGTVAFAGYGLGAVPASIWYKKKWSTTWKSLFDALIYGLLSAGVFGWLWP